MSKCKSCLVVIQKKLHCFLMKFISMPQKTDKQYWNICLPTKTSVSSQQHSLHLSYQWDLHKPGSDATLSCINRHFILCIWILGTQKAVHLFLIVRAWHIIAINMEFKRISRSLFSTNRKSSIKNKEKNPPKLLQYSHSST